MRFVWRGFRGAAVQVLRRCGVKRVVDQCRFAGTRNPGDADEQTHRNTYRYVLEVVAAGALHHEFAFFVDRMAQRRHGDTAASRKILARQRFGVRILPRQCLRR